MATTVTAAGKFQSMSISLFFLLNVPVGSGFRVKQRKRTHTAKQQQVKKEEAGAEYDDYGGPIGALPSVCTTNWTDSMKFDCQLYEGAGWCEYGADYQLGPAWCSKHKLCDRTKTGKGGYELGGNGAWGWGTFHHFKTGTHPTTAQQACRGCGADCPATPPTRQLNPIAEGCVDYSAPNGQAWRGSAGYTCGAYHHGGFCIKRDGRWVPGKLMEGYGALDEYAHWAMNGTNKVKMSPLQACCTCGGGSTCTNGLKPPSACEREFVYEGKLYSGCTTVANGEVTGGGAWCSRSYKYQANQWSKCSVC